MNNTLALRLLVGNRNSSSSSKLSKMDNTEMYCMSREVVRVESGLVLVMVVVLLEVEVVEELSNSCHPIYIHSHMMCIKLDKARTTCKGMYKE